MTLYNNLNKSDLIYIFVLWWLNILSLFAQYFRTENSILFTNQPQFSLTRRTSTICFRFIVTLFTANTPPFFVSKAYCALFTKLDCQLTSQKEDSRLKGLFVYMAEVIHQMMVQ